MVSICQQSYISRSLILYRHNITFEEHIWMLINILIKLEADVLLRYVVTTSHERILRRLQHPIMSTPYLTALENVKTIEFREFEQDYDKQGQQEVQNDLYVVHELLELPGDMKFDVEIPNLEKAALDSPSKIYTRDTCVEFHQLLCNLLRCFMNALSDLRNAKRAKTNHQAVPIHILGPIMAYGYLLHQLVMGAALTAHLCVIESSLIENRRIITSKASSDGIMEAIEEDVEEDVELLGIQPNTIREEGAEPVPLWESYRDWLRLVLVHFEAVDILFGYVNSSNFKLHYPN